MLKIKLYFSEKTKKSDGLTAYDIARQRAITSQEQTIALQFFKFNVSNEFPLTYFW